MNYDVVVVGGGIGGLATAALLAKHGVSTCLFERQSQVGGCIARTVYSGLDFDPGAGVYTSFGKGETFDRLFSVLGVNPSVTEIETPYVVRIAGDSDVRLYSDNSKFSTELERVFPECAIAAIDFYDKLHRLAFPHRRSPGITNQLRTLFSKRQQPETLPALLANTSPRFQIFM